MPERQTEGWVLPHGARRWHYQGADRRTLCGRYGLFPDSDLRPDTDYSTSEDCATCRRKLDARKEK